MYIHAINWPASPLSCLENLAKKTNVKLMGAINQLVAIIRNIFQKVIQQFIADFEKMKTFFKLKVDEYNFSTVSEPLITTPLSVSLPAADGLVEPKTIQFIQTEDQLTVIKKAPPIKNLALQGGGMKGVVYPTFLKVLEQELGFISSLKEISGSSAGAMMAFMLAIGLSVEEIETLLSQSNILQQMVSAGSSDLNLGYGIFPAGMLADTFKNVAQNVASLYFDAIKDDHQLLLNVAFLNCYDSFMQHGLANFEDGITFNDLKFLNLLNPQKFKQLHITGFDRKLKETFYFNAKNNPDMHCHEAVRISMAFPILVKSVIRDGKQLSDGGEGSNMPLEVFSSREDYKPEETMAITFDEQGKAHKILHDPIGEDAWHGPKTSAAVQAMLGQHYAKVEKADAHKIYTLGPNVLVMPHGDLDTFSFAADQQRIDAAKAQAEQAARQYAIWRRHLAMHELQGRPQELQTTS